MNEMNLEFGKDEDNDLEADDQAEEKAEKSAVQSPQRRLPK